MACNFKYQFIQKHAYFWQTNARFLKVKIMYSMINAFAKRNNTGTQNKWQDKESERDTLMRRTTCLITGEMLQPIKLTVEECKSNKWEKLYEIVIIVLFKRNLK